VHFGEGEAELFPLDKNMLVPCEPTVQMKSEVFAVFRLGELHIVEMDRWARRVVKVTWVDLVSLAFSRQSNRCEDSFNLHGSSASPNPHDTFRFIRL
jgi:hypothetical protein